ncbi:hypothetical protein GSI_09930 [Ganoderma sinense ZZ0214-1]|uniref:BTB domain-containing protein n=1 Tax=Ganoderma sinense ZZ0214-1 TaxID=1077348 RepID=A0A2G8S2J4_9APHY|nr:hypothetical protein GSI_09930 [Ganoderma sinense ZZ0214-1]
MSDKSGGSTKQNMSKSAPVESKGPRKIKALPSRPVNNIRDNTFWYSDGNIVIQAGVKLFKLHASRLQRFCVYFKEMVDLDGGDAKRIEACPVHNVPQGATAEGFKAVLYVVEVPFETFTSKLTLPGIIAMLEAAHLLSCNSALHVAKRRLATVWDPHPVPARPDPENVIPYTSTIATIHRAGDYNLFSIEKRAFYELLSSENYWQAYFHTNRESIDLSAYDRERLLHARDVLGRWWREFVLTPPEATQRGNPATGRTKCKWCTYKVTTERERVWRLFIIGKGDLEHGALDPLRYNLVDLRRQDLLNEWWCMDCLRNKENAWKAKTVEWWGY